MGRFTNSKGLRLGIFKNWKDRLPVSLEVLYSRYRIQEYLERVFEDRRCKGIGLLFESVDIKEYKGRVYLDVFLYVGILEESGVERGLEVVQEIEKIVRVLDNICQEQLSKFLKRRVYLTYFLGDKGNITGAMVAKYFAVKLEQGYSLAEIGNIVEYNLENVENLLGYRIECRGRFSRWQRSSYKQISRGSVPISRLDKYIEWGFSSVILRYGSCGIKVWLHKKVGVKEEYNLVIRGYAWT